MRLQANARRVADRCDGPLEDVFLHEKLRFHVAHLSAKSPVLETQKTRIADQKLTALSTQKRSRLLYEKLFSHCFGRLINRLLRRTRPAFKTTPCFLDAKD